MRAEPPARNGLPVLRGLLAIVGSIALILALPTLTGQRGQAPPIWLLVVAGVGITACTAPALSFMIRSRLGLPARIALLTVGYHVFIVLVKFTLAPFGLYEVNQEVPLEAFANVTEPLGAILAAVAVLLLYAAVYVLIYRVVRKRVAELPPLDERPSSERSNVRFLVLSLVAGVLLLAGTGGAIVLLAAAGAGSGLEYLEFVFTSGVSLLVATALAGASALAGLTFARAADRAQIVGDATAFVGLFWVGLAFIALYHVLWVVFILVLASTWPLRVVVPK